MFLFTINEGIFDARLQVSALFRLFCVTFFSYDEEVEKAPLPKIFEIAHSFCRGLISPAKEKKEEKKSKLVRKFTRNKADKYVPAPTRAPGLAGLMETMRTQMEVDNDILFLSNGYILLLFNSCFMLPMLAFICVPFKVSLYIWCLFLQT